MFSIIIPAHNEERVIEKTLESVLACDEDLNKEVIVVCNGCTDGTENLVDSFGSAVTRISTDVPSKANALNLGDSAANGFPRLYLDADIQLSTGTFSAIGRALESDGCLAVSPKVKMDLSRSSWIVFAYYDIWLRLPYCKEGMIGAGAYAMSREGRSKFEDFPMIIADDGYVRCLFNSDERSMVEDCCSIVKAPEDLMNLIKIKTRSRLGGYELFEKFPHLKENEDKEYKQAIRAFLPQIKLWPAVLTYFLINLVVRIRARKMYNSRAFDLWERDESNR